MKLTLAFDVYGTLIDTHSVVGRLKEFVGSDADAFTQIWRSKQLEYTFRRGLMKRYQNFAVCTQQSLEYTCRYFGIRLDSLQLQELLKCYNNLSAYDDVSEGLNQLSKLNCRMFAFTNGSAKAVEDLLDNANLRYRLSGVISVDEVQSFKPDPAVYQHFLKATGSNCEYTWLVSGNSFDVIGARSVGMQAAWVQRSSKDLYDSWEFEPTIKVASMCELATKISEHQNNDLIS